MGVWGLCRIGIVQEEKTIGRGKKKRTSTSSKEVVLLSRDIVPTRARSKLSATSGLAIFLVRAFIIKVLPETRNGGFSIQGGFSMHLDFRRSSGVL